MTHSGIDILTFSGVTSEQLAKLDKALKSEPMLEKAEFPYRNWAIYAAIKTTRWDTDFGTMTIEIEIFPYQRWLQNPERDPKDAVWKDNEKRPTPRWVVDSILDPLERLPKAAA